LDQSTKLIDWEKITLKEIKNMLRGTEETSLPGATRDLLKKFGYFLTAAGTGDGKGTLESLAGIVRASEALFPKIQEDMLKQTILNGDDTKMIEEAELARSLRKMTTENESGDEKSRLFE